MNENDILKFLPKDSDNFQYSDELIGYLYRNGFCEYPTAIVSPYGSRVTFAHYPTSNDIEKEDTAYDLDIQVPCGNLPAYTKLCNVLAEFLRDTNAMPKDRETIAVMEEGGKWPTESVYNDGFTEKYPWSHVIIYDKATGTVRRAEEADGITEDDYKRAKRLVKVYEEAQTKKSEAAKADDDWEW